MLLELWKTMPASPRRPRTALSPTRAYALAAGVIFMSLFASGAPSPLYGTYSALWGFSPIVLTVVYATYAFGVLASLILAGRLSDDVGRRPVLLGAIGALMVSTVLFMLADSVAWLFVARGLQGIATGASLSAASAALLDLHPRRDTAGVSLTNGVASTAGIGLGVLVSAALVQLAPAPRVLPYVAELVLFAIAFAGALRMPETVAHRSRLRLQPERPSVPRALRRPFFLAGMAALSAYTVGGLFLSLGPQFAAQLFHTPNHLVAGLGVFALAASASAAQRVFGRVPPWAEAAGGSVALALGMLVIVLAVTAGSSTLFLIGAVIGGGGFGVTYLGGLRALAAVIPPEHRAGVMSAFYIVAYAALSVPAIAAGAATTSLGLRSTFEIFGAIASGLAMIVAVEAWRTRPRAAQLALETPGPTGSPAVAPVLSASTADGRVGSAECQAA
jgi:MFS family permease